ncbi:MAG: hypothetical protein WD733_25960 [Bryobacterales bacterium]
MTFEERLKQIELEEQDAALAKLETSLGDDADDGAAESPPPSYIEQGAPVHCSECGNNTFREEHDAIMCSNCGHGPFCNYCWKVHIRDFHPLLVQPYEDATRGIRRRARFLNHYLIRTVVKPAGIVVGMAALFTAAYFAYVEQRERPAANAEPHGAAATLSAEPASADPAANTAPVGSDANVRAAVPSANIPAAGQAANVPAAVRATNVPAAGPAASVPEAGPPHSTAPVARVPTATAPANPAAMELQSVTSPVSRGMDANLAVRAAPGALCTIQVRYRSGPSKARGLEPKIAGESGLAEWSWRVGRQTRAGEWPIDIACTVRNVTSRLTASIVVTDQ